MANIPVGTYINAFDKTTFTKNFIDEDQDRPCEVVILRLADPTKGVLFYNNTQVEIGFTFNYKDSANLSYFRVSPEEFTDSFDFKISDNNQNKLYSNMATVTINISAYVNLPPDQVGDLTISISHGATKIFTTNDFTVNLVPVYHDPEGDAPSKLKVLTLPNSGLLRLNGINVIVNQEIDYADIDAGNFMYIADGTIMTGISTLFTFSVSDMGSGTFTS